MVVVAVEVVRVVVLDVASPVHAARSPEWSLEMC